MMFLTHYFLFNSAYAADSTETNRRPAQKTTYTIKVLVPDQYKATYEETHESLGSDLQKIKDQVEEELNKSVRFKENGIQIAITLQSPTSHPVMDELDDTICEGSMTTITSVLNKINVTDAASHYIVLLPCSSNNYVNVFNSVHVDIPLVQHKISVECSNRIAIFQERESKYLLASFGNAILKVLGAPMDDYAKLTTTNTGDAGVTSHLTVSEEAIHQILNSKCFFNILSL